jgi:spore coat polysaccharide biosynthesis protein SpsF
MKRKLVAAIACRNQGTRLYGKPIQNLDVVNKVRIIDNIIDCLNSISCINEIVLGISEGVENEIYIQIAKEKKIKYIIGDEEDVLARLIQCGKVANATDILRITSESPFLYYEPLELLWEEYVSSDYDAIFLDEIIDGCSFQIVSMDSLEVSHRDGEDRHRSEFCTLFIRENLNMFNVKKVFPPSEFIRKDLRLTVDNPEDLVVCRILYNYFKEFAPKFPISKMIEFLDKNSELKKLTAPFCEIGYSTMYK